MRRRSARAMQYSERSILSLSSAYRYTGAFLKLRKFAQSQSTLDKRVNFAFRARLYSFTTKQVPRPQSSRAAGSGETALSRRLARCVVSSGALKPPSNACVKLTTNGIIFDYHFALLKR